MKPLLKRLLKGILYGAAWGVVVVATGYARRSLGFGSRPTEPFWTDVLVGTGMGAVMGPLIVLLQPLDGRGFFWHYAVWMFASMCAICAMLLVLDPTFDSTKFEFGCFMGFCMGLGLGTITRKAMVHQ